MKQKIRFLLPVIVLMPFDVFIRLSFVLTVFMCLISLVAIPGTIPQQSTQF